MQAFRRAAVQSSKFRFPQARTFARSFATAPQAAVAAPVATGPDEADLYVDSLVKGEFDKNVNKISEIMAGDDHSKKALILKALERAQHEMDAEAGKEVPFMYKYGFQHKLIAIPLGVVLGYPILKGELMLETDLFYLTNSLLAFGVFYSLLHNMRINQNHKDRVSRFRTMKKIEYNYRRHIEMDIESTKDLVGVETEYKEFHQLVDDMAALQAEILNAEQEAAFREAVSKKLETVVNMEVTAMSNVKSKMIEGIKADVRKHFATDKTAKESMLTQAVTVLSTGADYKMGKMGKDIVGEAFVKALQNFRAAQSKLDPNADPAMAQLKKDLLATAVPPSPEFAGGNVYDNFPQIQKFLV